MIYPIDILFEHLLTRHAKNKKLRGELHGGRIFLYYKKWEIPRLYRLKNLIRYNEAKMSHRL